MKITFVISCFLSEIICGFNGEYGGYLSYLQVKFCPRPTLSCEKTDTTTKKPDPTTKKPDPTTEKPDTTTQQPDPTTEKPKTEETAVTTPEPAETTPQPEVTGPGSFEGLLGAQNTDSEAASQALGSLQEEMSTIATATSNTKYWKIFAAIYLL